MKAQVGRAFSSIVPLWILVAGLGLVVSLGGVTLDRALAQGLITLVIVVGLGIFLSNSGVLSFGHMAFAAIGGYTTAIVTMSAAQRAIQLGNLPESIAGISLAPITAALLSAAPAAAFALLLSLPLMRLSGLTAALATFAVLIVIRVVAQNLDTFTRGTRGLILDAPSPSMWILLVVALLSIAIAIGFSQSKVGLRLIASREDEAAARSLGIRVWWERGIAWVLSAMIVAVGGALFAWQFRSINPDSFYLSYTFIVVAMLVVGGINTVTGAVVGTVVVSVGVELLRAVEGGITLGPLVIPARPGLSELGLAMILLSTLILRPSGLVGNREARLDDWRFVRFWSRQSKSKGEAEISPQIRDSEAESEVTDAQPGPEDSSIERRR